MALTEIGGDTREMINQVDVGAKRSAGDLARQTLAGTQDVQRLINTDENFESGLSGDISGKDLSSAISSRTQQRFGEDYGALKKQVNYQEMNRKFKRLGEAADLVAMENAHNAQVRAARHQMRINRKKARGAVLGNILGVVGAVVGGIYGGPAGAAAGSKAGQALGQGIGGG